MNRTLFFYKHQRLGSNAESCLTLSRRRPISHRNQSIDLLCKSMDWFLYDIGLRRERVKAVRKLLNSCLVTENKVNHIQKTFKDF